MIDVAEQQRRLVVLACCATKLKTEDELPAVHLYDGPTFRILRTYLREYRWPTTLSLAVLSAEHGLIGGMSPVVTYDRRMTPDRALSLAESVTESLTRISQHHHRTDLVLGKDYLRSINLEVLPTSPVIAEGPIGLKLQHFRNLLHSLPRAPKSSPSIPTLSRPLYFLPDWDDFLDVDYDFSTDQFSADARACRNERHSIGLMRPDKLCDGVLVSLAQNFEAKKGLLKRVSRIENDALAPASIRSHFDLRPDQLAFGDCGAFSYVNEAEPIITTQQAVSLYDLHGFDFGASVDHIPVSEIRTEQGSRVLTLYERQKRVSLTRQNAQSFIDEHKARKCSFIPVGIIQGLGPRSFANQVLEYYEMGYDYVALGGLVPRTDSDITQIVTAVRKAMTQERAEMAIHLLGVFRPNLQQFFKESGIFSFDSASYFRKAWLRSNQNYLGTDGTWYSAIRVPPSHDPRTFQRMRDGGHGARRIARLEKEALTGLRSYDAGKTTLEKCLESVMAYDALLSRASIADETLLEGYRATLLARPWRKCSCPMCRTLGIEILIFRGLNRNKRRGAHNTLQLFRQVQE